MDNNSSSIATDPARLNANGYYVPGGGAKDTSFQNLFLKLRPKLVVNDNIYIKSEWWLGNPIFGLFGNSLPYTVDQKQFYSSQSAGSTITAQRFWGEFVTDLGTFQVGRVPLHWGLGIVWSSGDNFWDRYISTGDAVRWIAKFGAFSFIPSFIVNSSGNTIGGSCVVIGQTCVNGLGVGGVTDYSLILKYENLEEDLEGGINIIRRIGGSGQDPASGVLVPQNGFLAQQAGVMNFNTYSLYARKKFTRFILAAEVPIITGQLGNSSYQTFGFASEATWKTTDSVEMLLKAGYASGQPNSGGGTIDTFRTFYFNPNYKIAMILFNYQLSNFAGPQNLNNPNLSQSQLKSPYDNPIVNAMYLSVGSHIKPWEKWSLNPVLTYARAHQVASSSQYFYNYSTRSTGLAVQNQGSELGWEFDLGITFQWDEYFQFTLDNGIFFPGNFYAFSNSSITNATNPVFASSVRIGVNF